MTTKEEQLARIYENMARKDLSFGCKGITLVCGNYCFLSHPMMEIWTNEYNPERHYSFSQETIEIIGHPVLLSDVLNWGDNHGQTKCEYEMFMENWDMSKPTIDEQSPECIQYISDLIPNNITPMSTISREAVMKEIDEMIEGNNDTLFPYTVLQELKSRIESIPQEPTLDGLLRETGAKVWYDKEENEYFAEIHGVKESNRFPYLAVKYLKEKFNPTKQ